MPEPLDLTSLCIGFIFGSIFTGILAFTLTSSNRSNSRPTVIYQVPVEPAERGNGCGLVVVVFVFLLLAAVLGIAGN